MTDRLKQRVQNVFRPVCCVITALVRGGLLLLISVLPALAADNTITGLRLGAVESDGQQALRIVVETARPQPGQLLLLSDPWRLVIDFPQTGWAVDNLPPSGALAQHPAVGYRFGHPRAGTGRLVIELARPASPERAFSLPPGAGGHRLVVDLMDRGEISFRVAQKALAAEPFSAEEHDNPDHQIATPVQVRPVAEQHNMVKANMRPADITGPAPRPQRWIVAIDAGHGGKDPGAIGKKGTREKDITLAAARQLAAHLHASGRVSARLIRADDRYYKLRERIRIARDMGADVFISLHADSAKTSSARGISVFSLSDKASDKEAAYLARQENKADLIGGPDLAGEDPLAANALLGMFQRETMNESAYLARAILDDVKTFPGGDKRGHRFAGFAVLKSPDIPSVLVEMGFLSNKEDEQNLNSRRYRDRLTQRLAGAVLSYLEMSKR